jgi:hypothetical protein
MAFEPGEGLARQALAQRFARRLDHDQTILCAEKRLDTVAKADADFPGGAT